VRFLVCSHADSCTRTRLVLPPSVALRRPHQ
jgi:hypothetical protein